MDILDKRGTDVLVVAEMLFRMVFDLSILFISGIFHVIVSDHD